MATIIISLMFCLSLFLSSVPVHSAVFTVSSGDVTGLIAAINAANANGEENTINLEPGTYTLTSVNNIPNGANGVNGLPIITADITISGDDTASTIIEREVGTPPFRIFHIAAGGKLRISGLTVRQGDSSRGGGVLNEGKLTIESGIIEQNANFSNNGGGIRNMGTLMLTQSIVRDNLSVFGPGGGIDNGGTLILMQSTVTDNTAGRGQSGGGINNFGTATAIDSTITHNSAPAGGGGIDNRENSFFTIHNSSITENLAPSGGGIGNDGTMTITNSTIANNNGGQGAGILNHGTLKIINSTISGNNPRANPGEGGGIQSDGSAAIVEIQNSVVALNAGAPGPDCLGAIISLGNNIIGDLNGCNIGLLPSDLIGNPGLGAFIDDGAPGNGRFPLLAGSPAINAGNDAACSATDQLDTPRLGACDIGAIEFYPVVNDLVAVGNVSTDFDATPVPGGPAGTFRITADLTNTSNQTIVNPFVEVVELTGGNLLLNADGGAGGVGARLRPTDSDTTIFQPGTSSTFEFLIGLQKREPFTFFVNMLGEPRTSNPSVSKR